VTWRPGKVRILIGVRNCLYPAVRNRQIPSLSGRASCFSSSLTPPSPSSFPSIIVKEAC
jgi:hypothetical protein